MSRGGGATPPSIERAAERLRELLRQRDLLSLECAELAGMLESAGYARTIGSETTVDWIRHECKLAHAAAADLVCVGSQLERLPESVEAVAGGEIGFGHLVHIARAQRQVGESRLDERTLVAEAKEVSVSRFWYVCQQARHACDPQGVADEARSQHEARSLTIRRREDGMVSLGGILDPVSGASVRAALEPLAVRCGKPDDRTREQRLADALVELARSKTQVHTTVSVTLGSLLQVPNSAPGDLHGELLPQASVQRMLCEGSIRRMVFEPGSIVTEAGRERRVVSSQTRRALEVRDQHCRWPGCQKPARWCEAHHVIHWTRGGATNTANLVLLCGHHHRLLHEGRWKLLLHPGGRVEVVRPPLDFHAPPSAPGRAA